MTTPSPPVPGDDCFPVRYCTETTESCTALGIASPTTDPDGRAVQVFIDADGYIWVAIISYEWSATVPVPHWVWLFKSEFPVDCEDVRAAGETGWSPASNFTLVSDGRHKDSLICDDTTTAVVQMDAGSVSFVAYSQRSVCCDLPLDPCNVAPEGACDDVPSGETCEGCSNCDDNTAPVAVLLEIDHNTSWLSYADGSFVLELATGCNPLSPTQCSWFGCFQLASTSIPGFTIESVTFTLTFASGTMQLLIEHWDNNDCGTFDPACEFQETITWSADSDCDTWFESFNPPSSYSITGCSGPVSLPAYNTPNGRVRAL